jgi:hypothetical protein
MAVGYGHHDWNETPRPREADVLRKLKHRGDAPLLFELGQISKRSGEIPASAGKRSAACPVVPVRRRVQPSPAPIEANQQFLDQQSIIEDDVH